jgi:hypothetical protein
MVCPAYVSFPSSPGRWRRIFRALPSLSRPQRSERPWLDSRDQARRQSHDGLPGRRGCAAVHTPRLRLDLPAVREAAEAVQAKSFLIDGEAVCCDQDGVTVFEMLRQRRNAGLVFLYAFDLLQVDGRDLRREPIEIRKAQLANLIRGASSGIQLNDHIQHEAAIVFEHACKLGLEGIVSKRSGSRYVSGRSSDWIKLKNPDSPAVKREAEEDWGR